MGAVAGKFSAQRASRDSMAVTSVSWFAEPMRVTTRLLLASVVVVVLGSVSCQKAKRDGGKTGGAGGRAVDAEVVVTKGGVPPRAPALSRPVAVECSRERPPGKPSAEPNKSPECKVDADCKAGINGRCNEHYGGHGFQFSGCDYDRCFSDAECGGGVCTCSPGGNYCNPPGNCLVDSDCGRGGFCSPTNGEDPEKTYSTVQTYFCRTPKDECVTDEDCAKAGESRKTCTYGRSIGHWLCIDNQMCPVG